jgi:hypothetical protein
MVGGDFKQAIIGVVIVSCSRQWGDRCVSVLSS